MKDERLKLRWGVEAKGVLIAAFASKVRAESIAAAGRLGTPDPISTTIRVVDCDERFPVDA